MNGVEQHTFPLSQDVAEQLDELRDDLPEPNAIDHVRDYIGNNPWQAIGIAAVVGLFCGIVSRRGW